MTWTTLKYGWLILSSLYGDIDKTIFVSGNTTNQLYSGTFIQLLIGNWERCEAAKYATNSWGVNPPYDVRTFVVGGVTSTVTNAWVWTIDWPMITNGDVRLRALLPYYTTNSVISDGDNPAMSNADIFPVLPIGDSVSLFTRTPEWISVAIATNGVTNITTNAATYGDLPWQVYPEDLVERYKYIWTLKQTLSQPPRTYAEQWGSSETITTNYHTPLSNGIARAYAGATGNYGYVTNGFLIGSVWTNSALLQTSSLCQWSRAREWVQTNIIGTNYIYDTNIVVTLSNYPPKVVATGGSITNIGGYTIHTFTEGGTFTLISGSPTCEVLVVAGGGAGGGYIGGGGGAGGVVYNDNFTLTGSVYSVIVGLGGVTSNGQDSSFGTNTVIGGGYGAASHDFVSDIVGSSGGSGGGGGSLHTNGWAGTPGQGYSGGNVGYSSNRVTGGGGGGANEKGGDSGGEYGGNGGNGYTSSISGSIQVYGGGGAGSVGGGVGLGIVGQPGTGGGGKAALHDVSGNVVSNGSAGAENTGGGGGGGGSAWTRIQYKGGSGIVIVKYYGISNVLDPRGTYWHQPAYDVTPPSEVLRKTYRLNNTGQWWIIFNTNLAVGYGRQHFISTNIDQTFLVWTSSWQQVNLYYPPVGEYPITHSLPGELATGTAYAVWGDTYTRVTNYSYYTSVYYQVQLQKIGATNDLYTSTNIEHKVIGYYAYPTRDTWGATNEYTNQGLSLIESNWNEYYSNGWAWGSTNPGWFAGARNQIETPPACPPEISTNAAGGTSSRGFIVGPDIKAVADWKFQYCTNKFW